MQDAPQVEHALCNVIEYLENDDPQDHCRFLGLLLGNERKIPEEDNSYYLSITKLSAIQ